MQTSTTTKAKVGAAKEPYHRVIDLGNGVMYPVNNEQEANFVEWMIEEAKAGRASLPKRSPKQIERPAWLDTEPKIKHEDWWANYEYCRSDRF
ncbi:MAG: hypothetical protein FWC15_02830 [Fibromonadales bacterium]|nr:hypothetical protein [Fibromonadales bacterium]